MRLVQYITEKTDRKLLNQIEQVVRKCSQYYKEIGTAGHLFRGTSTRSARVEARVPRKDRKPRDTNMDVHLIMDKLLYKNFGWHPRKAGVFVTADQNIASSYGKYHPIFIPANGYKYLYSSRSNYGDMTAVFDNMEFDPDYYASEDWDELYEPGYGLKGKWISKDIKKTFQNLDALEYYMDTIHYYITKQNKFQTVWKNIRDKNKIVTYDWIVQGGFLTKKEYDIKQKEFVKSSLEREVLKKGQLYVNSLRDTGLKNIIKREASNEIMFKCKYYYLIDDYYIDDLDELIKAIYGK